jgi:hypothetical protein
LFFWHVVPFVEKVWACCAYLKLARPCRRGNGLMTLAGTKRPCTGH